MSDINNFVHACGPQNDKYIARARLLMGKVDINGRDSYGQTGLMRAMVFNNLPIVRMLLDHPDILGKFH